MAISISASIKQSLVVVDSLPPVSVMADDSDCLLCSLLTFYLRCDPIYPFSIQTLLVLTRMTGQMPGG